MLNKKLYMYIAIKHTCFEVQTGKCTSDGNVHSSKKMFLKKMKTNLIKVSSLNYKKGCLGTHQV